MVRLRVKEVAEERGWKLSSLAREAKVYLNTASRYWHNTTSSYDVEIMVKFARVLGVRFTELIDDTEMIPDEEKQVA